MKKFLLAAVAALAWGQTSVAQAAPQSLAEVAKQSRTERKTVKVFTDEDLPARFVGSDPKAATLSVVPSDSSRSTESAAAPTEKKEDAKEADKQSNSTPAVAELKKKLDSYEQERNMWNSSAKHYEDLLANETVDFRREMYQDALTNDKKNMALFQEKIDLTQAELAKTKKATEHEPENSSPPLSGAQP
ncbi:MAG TPA: hypothetical protein VGK24_08785 [Candidatus Angelobacter sp.]|jgi:hypothetical protein